MGYLHKGVCYPDLETARAEVCSDANLVSLSGQNVYASSCTASDFTQSTYGLVVSFNGTQIGAHTLSYPSFSDCSHTYSADLVGSWLVASLFLFATLFGIKTLIDLFSGKHDA